MKRITLTTASLAFAMVTCMTSCKKDNNNAALKDELARQDNGTASANLMAPAAVNNTWTINWNNRVNGATYTQGMANTDFGNTSTWYGAGGVYTTNGNNNTVGCRVTLVPNQDDGGGLIANTVISNGTAYEMDYDVKFHSQFNWGKGGKVGFGFGIGDHNTGGDPAWDGNGGTLRLMWYNTGSRVFFQPYLYYKDQPGQFGDTFGASYPSGGSLNKGQWYHVHLYIKSNNGSNANGHVQIVINGSVILDRDIRWTTNDGKRLIDQLTWHTFRGGNDSSWWTNTTDYIYYDNLVIHRISS